VYNTHFTHLFDELFLFHRLFWYRYISFDTYVTHKKSRSGEYKMVWGVGFCKRDLWKRRYSAKETYNLIDPTDRSHPICVWYPFYTCLHRLFLYRHVSLTHLSHIQSLEVENTKWCVYDTHFIHLFHRLLLYRHISFDTYVTHTKSRSGEYERVCVWYSTCSVGDTYTFVFPTLSYSSLYVWY